MESRRNECAAKVEGMRVHARRAFHNRLTIIGATGLQFSLWRSNQETALLSLERFSPGEQTLLTRSQFDLAARVLVEKIEGAVARLLPEAGVKAADIDTIFFTGGSSGIPLLRRRISSLLPQAQVVEGDLFGSIGTGLAVDAARRYGMGR